MFKRLKVHYSGSVRQLCICDLIIGLMMTIQTARLAFESPDIDLGQYRGDIILLGIV